MRVAAIQMTSGHEIDANLEAAGRFLSDAARLGALLAALPENFAFMGRDSGDKRAIAEPDGAGKIQNFLADTAAVSRYGSSVARCRCGRTRMAGSAPRCWCTTRRASAWRAYDKMHLFDVDVPGSASRTANRRTPCRATTRASSRRRWASSGSRCVTTCASPSCSA
jgi:nitrilase